MTNLPGVEEIAAVVAEYDDLNVGSTIFKKNVKRSAKIEDVYRKEEYDDRIEITSPGGLLPQISLSDLGT